MLQRGIRLAWIPMLALVAGWDSCGADDLSPVGDLILQGDDDDDGSPWIEEEFNQQVGEKTDVLFVVDNSCSMMEEQNALQFDYHTTPPPGSTLRLRYQRDE